MFNISRSGKSTKQKRNKEKANATNILFISKIKKNSESRN